MSAPTATVAAASSLAKYGNYLMGCLPQSILKISVFKDELSLHVPPSSVPKVLEFLRDHPNCQYKQLMEMTAVDYPTREHRFEIVYCLLSPHYNSRIIVRSYGGESLPVPSVSHLFSSAIWSEREAWDMFGVIFTGHPDLRRILTDYGFEGHPLRKDFPLTGFTEVRYDEEKKRIVQEPVELSQEFRKFDFPNPWEQVPMPREQELSVATVEALKTTEEKDRVLILMPAILDYEGRCTVVMTKQVASVRMANTFRSALAKLRLASLTTLNSFL